MQLPRMLFALLCMMVFALAGPRFAAAAEDGAKVFEESCTPCHTPKVRTLDNMHLTKEQWKDAIERMIDQGAEVPKAKRSVLLDYLVNTHGPMSAPTGTITK